MKKVLIIEDDIGVSTKICNSLTEMLNEPEVLQAFTAEEGENLIVTNPDVDLILLDGCLNGDHPDGIDLIPTLREYHPAPKPILAISRSIFLREVMMERGCTHECDKKYAVANALRILRE